MVLVPRRLRALQEILRQYEDSHEDVRVNTKVVETSEVNISTLFQICIFRQDCLRGSMQPEYLFFGDMWLLSLGENMLKSVPVIHNRDLG